MIVEIGAGKTATEMYMLPSGVTVFDVVWHDPRIEVAKLESWVNEEVLPLQLNARFEVRAEKPGRYRFTYAYVSTGIQWDAAYTATTGPDRRTATVRGALALHNQLGAPLANVQTWIIDADIGGRDDLKTWVGAAKPDAFDLGVIALANGQTRIPLLANELPRALRSVMVFDPIGTALDSPTPSPVTDPELGAKTVSASVTESLELARPAATRGAAPGGVARLLEQAADGSLVLLAEGRLHDAATRDATSDTFPIGSANDVIGVRERRELTVDKQIHEDFRITLTSKRGQPVEILLREHLYRGQNWTLAYNPAGATKEGMQQIAMRVQLPARGQANVFYSVLYKWP